MADLLIREATESDLPDICALEQLCFSRPWSRELFANEISSANSSLWCAFEDGVFCGFLSAMVVYDQAHITNVAVSPDFRRRGIAGALMMTAIADAKHQNLVLLTLEVRVSNLSARALYEKYGFSVIGIRPHYYDDNGEDAVIMDKII